MQKSKVKTEKGWAVLCPPNINDGELEFCDWRYFIYASKEHAKRAIKSDKYLNGVGRVVEVDVSYKISDK